MASRRGGDAAERVYSTWLWRWGMETRACYFLYDRTKLAALDRSQEVNGSPLGCFEVLKRS